MTNHIPVMLDETVKSLKIIKNGCYVDATFGSGGHSTEILNNLGPNGKLFSLDKDHDAITIDNPLKNDKRFTLKHGCFSNLSTLTKAWGIHGAVNGILFDLGVSSYHFDTADRGFSFSLDSKLDMRFDRNKGQSAFDWLRGASENELANVIWKYGEERYSRRIARAIVRARKSSTIKSTVMLSDIVNKSIPKKDPNKNNATRTFQAIRIFINQELDVLKKALESSYEILAPEGRLVLITYHSLEDKIIKDFLVHTSGNLSLPKKLPIKDEFLSKMFNLISKSIKPTANEIKTNRRSRSAKLSVLEKT